MQDLLHETVCLSRIFNARMHDRKCLARSGRRCTQYCLQSCSKGVRRLPSECAAQGTGRCGKRLRRHTCDCGGF